MVASVPGTVDASHGTHSARLLADVGGTNARFAWQAGPAAAIGDVIVLPCAQHASLADAITAYLAQVGRAAPPACAIAIANPGGIVPRLGARFDASPFRERFESKGRFTRYLAAIPVFVILALQSPALMGGARALDAS